MLRMEVPNVFFDMFGGNNFDDDDDWYASPKHCRMDWSSAPLRVPSYHGVKPQARRPVKSPASFCRRNLQPQFRVEPLVKPEPVPEPFKVDFDLESFQPSEISVKLEGDTLLVRGNHEQKHPDGRFEHHEYIKKVKLPENVLTDQIRCKLDQRGQLQVEAPVQAKKGRVQGQVKAEQVSYKKQTTAVPEPTEPKPVPAVVSQSKVNQTEEPMESDPLVTIEDIGPE